MTVVDPTLHGAHRSWSILVGNVLDVLGGLPDESVHTVVTSPPYYGLRDYDSSLAFAWPDGWEGQLGHEPTVDLYAAHLADVFDDVHRVLRPEGTLWLNLGDCYAGSGGAGGDHAAHGLRGGQDRYAGTRAQMDTASGLKAKDLIGVPWLVAFELRRRGWWLRKDIIWHKPNPMPESPKDRPVSCHEYVFLFAKRRGYFYDDFAVMEDSVSTKGSGSGYKRPASLRYRNPDGSPRGQDRGWQPTRKRLRRDVWKVPVSTFRGPHFATFPEALIEPMVLAGTSEAGCCPDCGAPLERIVERRGKSVYAQMKEAHGMDASRLKEMASERGRPESHIGGTRTPEGRTPQLDGPEKVTVGWQRTCECEAGDGSETSPCVVLDPFSGAATTGLAALRHGRSYIGIEAVESYAEVSAQRLRDELGILAQHGEVRR